MKRGGPNHPKTFAFAEAMGIRRAHAVGLLEMLFHFTAQYAPEGNVGRYSDKRIAAGMDWAGSPTKLVDALVATGWLDRSGSGATFVHDWFDHADASVHRRLARAGKTLTLQNVEVTEKVTDKRKHTLPVPLPEPLPQPLPLPHGEYPLLAAAIRKHDPAVDDIFVLRLVQTTMQACLSDKNIPAGEVDKITDGLLADAVGESFEKYTGRNGHGTGLLLSRVPQIVRTWAKEPDDENEAVEER